ncbi:MAG: peptidoglycan-binding protein [Magnetococcales bacterium]|nr:peptidoglycan-binding protein [Magnetococcales bacterium]
MVDPKIAEIQTKLKNRGYDVGHIDGVFGAKTQAAVAAFQKSEGLIPDGEVGKETYQALIKPL